MFVVAAFFELLKNGGKVKTFDNSRTEYSKSGLHIFNNQTRREAAKARRS